MKDRFLKDYLPRVALSLICLLPAAAAGADDPVDDIDSGLQRLIAGKPASSLKTAAAINSVNPAGGKSAARPASGRFDAKGRVLIHVHLDGTATAAQVSAHFASLNGTVVSSFPAYRHGILAVYLPVNQLLASAKIPGVRSLTMEHAPQNRAGAVTSQGTSVLQTDVLNKAGLKGDGITVGVLSDSFNTAYENTATPPATTAAQDVASGDLPVVNVLEDFPNGTDEGRAMCQIVHDEAPHAGIAFATGDVSEVDFANNIVALRTQAGANVIVDDIGYLDEPVFSDGLLAQAVNTVATSTTLPGKPAVYVSAAGNDGNNGYRSPFRNLSDAKVRQAGNHGNLKLNVTDKTAANYLAPSLTAGGWFNWNPNGGLEPVTTVSAPGPTDYGYAIFLQWDDLFDEDHGITVSYNFLVFDQDGNYLPDLSSTTSAFSVQQPIQGIGYLALGTNYQIAITASRHVDPKAGPIPPEHQIALYTDLDGASILEGKYFHPAPLDVPNIIGHPAAEGAIAAAAYAFSWRGVKPFAPELENYTSPGPATIYFDQNDQRLAQPEVRLKPEVAGVDGVVTTFFGSPYYNYPYAFFGTSAAAPSVAGVAALMLEAAGGAGSLDPATVKSALEASAGPRNSTVEMTQAFGASSAGYLAVSALGQSYFPNYLTVNYFGPSGGSIQQITIDGTAAGVVFDTNEFALESASGIAPGSVTVVSPSDSTSKFTLQFAKGTFTSGVSIAFDVPQDAAGTYPGYTQNEYGTGVEAEDLAYGATVSAKFSTASGSSLKLPFETGYLTTGYSPADGFGLINAPAAVESVLPASSSLRLP